MLSFRLISAYLQIPDDSDRLINLKNLRPGCNNINLETYFSDVRTKLILYRAINFL